MRFNPRAFDRFIANIGQEVLWRRAYACACLNPHSGAPDPKHQLCLGKGRLWDEPVETVIGIASQDVSSELIAAGLWESGDMVMTIPQESPVWEFGGQFDRVVLRNSTDMFSQPMTRGSPSERLIFPVAAVSRVFWLHPQTRNLVEGAVPTIGSDGRPTWPGGVGEPPPGTTYSISGEKFSEYYIYGQYPSDRNEHSGMRLPKRVTLRKFDLFGR